jgi:general secretion pathway protein C
VIADRFATAPFVQKLSDSLNGAGRFALKVPVRRWRQLLLVLVAIWMVHSAARLFWVVVPVPKQPVTQVVPKLKNATEAVVLRQINIQDLNDLFGHFDPSQQLATVDAQPDIDPENAPITQLNLILQGVLASNDPKYSHAIIGENNSQVLYKIGDEIENSRGVKVRDIADLWVILDNNGKAEKLWLYGEDGMKVASTRPQQPTYQPVAPQENVTQAEVTNDQLQDVKSIGDVVRFMVATENGQMIGYKVRPGRKRELFDQVGLKNDDIVISVNGIEVNEPQKVREVYQALKTATEANLEVMRDGSTQFIQIRMSSG